MKSPTISPIYIEGVFDSKTLEQMANEILFMENPLPTEYPILTARQIRTIKEREICADLETLTNIVDGTYTLRSYKKHRGV